MVARILVITLIAVVTLQSHLWAAAAFRSSSVTAYASRTNITVTAPTGIADGDVLLLACAIGAATSAPTMTPPAGFSAVSGTWPIDLNDGLFNVDVYVWYKIAASESGNYTATHTSASSQCYMEAVSGGSAAQPAATQNNGTSTPTTALSITPAANDALVVFISSDWADFANNLTAPTGTTPTFTERLDPSVTAALLYAADGVLATAGATGNKSITNNNGAAGRWAGVLVAIEAAGAATTTPNLIRGFGVPGMNSLGLGGPLP